MKPVCYLDMDGVIVDFVAGAFQAHGRHIPAGEVKWDFDKQLGIPADRFWAAFDREFWAGLPWTHEGKDLLAGLKDRFGSRVVLLTSPCATPGSVEGKLDWVKAHLPDYRRQVMVGPAKHLMAGPNKVLIDDHDGNIDSFRLEGGHALTVPRSWNRQAPLTRMNRFNVSHFLDTVDIQLGRIQ